MMKLDHFTVRTPDLETAKTFFDNLLDLKPGFRPSFNFPGHWLYGSDPNQAIVHLIGQKKDQPKLVVGTDTGALDHMAFQSDNFDAVMDRVKDHNFSYRENSLPGGLARQIFVNGPHGIIIEIVFANDPA